jgi:2-oxoglutarate ferredoxin oxidoreductase subunit alpha
VISEKEIPLTEIATRHGNRIMRNVAALGGLVALIGLKTKYIAEQNKREFGERRKDRRGQHSGFGGGV